MTYWTDAAYRNAMRDAADQIAALAEGQDNAAATAFLLAAEAFLRAHAYRAAPATPSPPDDRWLRRADHWQQLGEGWLADAMKSVDRG